MATPKEHRDQHEAADATGEATDGPPRDRRTRRALLTGGAAAAGALVIDAFARPTAVSAAGVVLGGTNIETSKTVIKNTRHSTTARAIEGQTTFTGAAGKSAGVYGESLGQNGVGLEGQALHGVNAKGVKGTSREGTGVRGVGGPAGVAGTGVNYGVRGDSESNYGVFGEGGYTGVFGSGPYGTYGTGSSSGAVGTSNAGYGVYGLGPVGVVGLATGDGGYGVWGYGSTESQYGVVGQGGYRGVYASGGNAGVYGTSSYVGLWGVATSTSGLNYGVYATTGSQTQGWAGVFNGRVYVGGELQKAGGGFQVDHPLEPDRRYLVHSFVEAPERLNVYSGTVTLDSRGRAIVTLPDYVGAANKDFRYQLTAVGAAAPDLHVAKKISGNAFSIAGGSAGQEVCWQVTGARQDAWAKANPLEAEPLKPERERGKYLHPELYGRNKAAGIHNLEETSLERRPTALDSEPTR